MAVLVLAEHDQGRLSPATARVVAAAGLLGPVDVLVVGQGVAAVADEAATLSGVARVLVADDPACADLAAEAIAPLLAGLAGPYDHLVAAAGAVGRDVIPRLAAMLDLMPVTDVVAIHGPDRFDRPIYAGNAIETLTSPQSKQLLAVRPSAFPPVSSTGSAPIEAAAVTVVPGPVRLVGTERTEGDRPDLSTARVVVSGGIALGSAENFKIVGHLAGRLGAAVGATRAAVDAGFAPNDWQVGQTGKVIAPDLYLAFGISGALQHLAGIQGAKTIVAVNVDPDAPLMKLADVAYVGDLFEVFPALEAELDRLGIGP